MAFGSLRKRLHLQRKRLRNFCTIVHLAILILN